MTVFYTGTQRNTWDEWLSTRPECVRKLAAEFPVGLIIEHEGKLLHLLGYNESDMLIFSGSTRMIITTAPMRTRSTSARSTFGNDRP